MATHLPAHSNRHDFGTWSSCMILEHDIGTWFWHMLLVHDFGTWCWDDMGLGRTDIFGDDMVLEHDFGEIIMIY